MELSFSSKDLEFRDEVRDFLANEYPKHVKEKIENGEPLTREDIVDWHKSLSAKGWMGFNWPVDSRSVSIYAIILPTSTTSLTSARLSTIIPDSTHGISEST